MTTILGISGSLRSASFNTALLKNVLGYMEAGSGVTTHMANIGSLPHYDGDLDGEEKPASVARLIDEVSRASALLIVSPEYNYSVPGVLKNAIDWVSRPAYRSPLAHKPVGIMGASLSPVGTARAQSHLRQILGGTVSTVFPYPDMLVGGAGARFDAQGSIVDESTISHLQRYAEAFVPWVRNNQSLENEADSRQ